MRESGGPCLELVASIERAAATARLRKENDRKEPAIRVAAVERRRANLFRRPKFVSRAAAAEPGQAGVGARFHLKQSFGAAEVGSAQHPVLDRFAQCLEALHGFEASHSHRAAPGSMCHLFDPYGPEASRADL